MVLLNSAVGLVERLFHHRAGDWARPVWWGKKLGCGGRFFASAVGYAKSFVSNNHEFCFLGDTETQRGEAAN
jgi:hypothetical protein